MDAAGHETVLHNFTGADGSNPYAGVIRDTAGNLYGTTTGGGSAGQGVIYKVDTAGHETVIYSFTGKADGGYPTGSVVRDSAGNLYGTTYGGGSASVGVVYKVDAAGHETVLYAFTGQADGGSPYAGVIMDTAGNLYGTTFSGGSQSQGVVYKLDAGGHETVLHTFTGGEDGNGPYAGVVRDTAGNLYGTTNWGGSGGGGVVYKLDPTGHETVLYNFQSGAEDAGGSWPYAGVTLDPAGNLYGTTFYGGSANAGVVYKLDSAGQETVLYNFSGGADGGNPYAGVTGDTAGNLYGTTQYGGSASQGVVYKLDPAGQETVLRTFNGTDGMHPYAGVTLDPAGNLYGTTFYGGSANAGVVYKVDTAGRETVLYNFTSGADGGHPCAGVTRDTEGNLYGTTPYGGSGWGVVYKVDATGHETVLYTFTGRADGGNPYAGVIADSAGNLYGTTTGGGSTGGGVVYKVDPTGHETVLYDFTTYGSGSQPWSGVIRDTAGNLYGTTLYGGAAGFGTVYKVDAAGRESVLHSFTMKADGGEPYAGVTLDSTGNLYGTTYWGGSAGHGVVYKVDAAGHETLLHTFTGGADGGSPYAGVVLDSAENLYGTTTGGGAAGFGTVYRVDATGRESVLHSFTRGADGGNPKAGVIGDSAGHLYGTTPYGGTKLSGAVFRIP